MLDWSNVREFSLELRWKGALTPIAVQFVPLEEDGGKPKYARLIFTPQGDETHWVLEGIERSGKAFQNWDTPDNDLKAMVEAALSASGSQFNFNRCFELPLESKQRYYVALTRKNEDFGVLDPALYGEKDDLHWVLNRFELPSPEFESWSSARIEVWLREQCRDPASELNFMIWWWSLEFEEMRDFVEEATPGLRTLKQLMRWVLTYDSHFQGANWKWDLSPTPVFGELLGDSQTQVTLPPFALRWRNFLRLRFLPDMEIENVPWCVHDELWILMDLRVEVATPTGHERIEAGLALREWLEKNATPEEFDAVWGDEER
jgi:hypothetical protein